jgi:hypothetical protein
MITNIRNDGYNECACPFCLRHIAAHDRNGCYYILIKPIINAYSFVLSKVNIQISVLTDHMIKTNLIILLAIYPFLYVCIRAFVCVCISVQSLFFLFIKLYHNV